MTHNALVLSALVVLGANASLMNRAEAQPAPTEPPPASPDPASPAPASPDPASPAPASPASPAPTPTPTPTEPSSSAAPNPSAPALSVEPSSPASTSGAATAATATSSPSGHSASVALAPAAPSTAGNTSPAAAPSIPEASPSLEESELEKQLVEDVLVEAATDEYRLDLYGYADFTYHHLLEDFMSEYPWSSFAVGRVNLYAAAELGDDWSSLLEVRFTYLPHGSRGIPDAEGNVPRTDTTAQDYTDLGRNVRTGSVALERAQVEYGPHPLFNLILGHWLTPYGIWNVDHGSPVVIGVRRPFIVGEALLPAAQSGVQIYGTHNLRCAQLGYHVGLSNGRGPIDTHQDLDDDKALTLRAFTRADTEAGTLTLGVSSYLGRFTDRSERFVLAEGGEYTVERPINVQYDELSVAADAKWEWGGLLVQSEAVSHEVAFRDDARYPDFFATEGPPGFIPDYRRLGVYGLGGYRFEWGGLMPFAGIEYYDPGYTPYGSVMAFWGGLNARPTPRVVLKAQYTYSWLTDTVPSAVDQHFNALDLQVAWSF